MKKTAGIAIVLALVAFLVPTQAFAGCPPFCPEPPPQCQPAPGNLFCSDTNNANRNVLVFQRAFTPDEIAVQGRTGARLIFQNLDRIEHTVTDDRCDTGGPCAFDVTLRPDHFLGQARSIAIGGALDSGHTYAYHCRIHPEMTGTIVVT